MVVPETPFNAIKRGRTELMKMTTPILRPNPTTSTLAGTHTATALAVLRRMMVQADEDCLVFGTEVW